MHSCICVFGSFHHALHRANCSCGSLHRALHCVDCSCGSLHRAAAPVCSAESCVSLCMKRTSQRSCRASVCYTSSPRASLELWVPAGVPQVSAVSAWVQPVLLSMFCCEAAKPALKSSFSTPTTNWLFRMPEETVPSQDLLYFPPHALLFSLNTVVLDEN